MFAAVASSPRKEIPTLRVTSFVPVLVHGLQQRFDVFEFLFGGQDPVQQTAGVGL
jgi:hypothetical protein